MTSVSTRRGIDVIRRVRKFARNQVNLQARIEVILQDGEIFSTGRAVIRDISFKGARLGKINLKKKCLPCVAFRIRLEFDSPEYQGINAVCNPVRISANEDFELAVEFDDISVQERPAPPKKVTGRHVP